MTWTGVCALTYLAAARLGVGGRIAAAAATVAEGVRGALRMLFRADTALLGAVAWWACDIAVLWACFHAFGEPPRARSS